MIAFVHKQAKSGYKLEPSGSTGVTLSRVRDYLRTCDGHPFDGIIADRTVPSWKQLVLAPAI